VWKGPIDTSRFFFAWIIFVIFRDDDASIFFSIVIYQYIFLVDIHSLADLSSFKTVTQLFLDSSAEVAPEDYVGRLYYPANFIKELDNLIKNFEYTFDVEGNQIFPSDTIKHNIVSEYKPAEYTIDHLNYKLLGFNITASDVKIHVVPTNVDNTKTRVNIPLLLAKDVRVDGGGELIKLSYNQVDLDSVYGVYDKNEDKMRVHVPVSIAAKYIQ
jgi:hypothetical protein